MRRPEQGNDLIDIAEIVAGEDTEGIADDIVEAAARQIEVDMPGFLFRFSLVEQPAPDEFCRRRIVARTPGLCDNSGRCRGRRG